MTRFLLIGLIAIAFWTAPDARAADASGASELRVATWGGAYGDAQLATVLKPFTGRTGIPIVPGLAGVELKELADPASKNKPDLVDLPALDAAEACAKGLLAPFDSKSLSPGTEGSTPREDFLVQPDSCSVPSTLMGDVVLYDRNKLKTRVPQHISDLFDVAGIPGKRALKRDAVGTLEWALLADNVPPAEVYAVLATPAGVARAFAKLDKIRDDVIWWDRGARPVELVERGEVVMAQVYVTRAFDALAKKASALGVLWDRALVTSNRWAIVRGAEDRQGAREFLSFATEPSRLAAFGNSVPYAPARRSSLRQIAPEMAATSLASPENFALAFPIDTNFWLLNAGSLRQRFETWLAAAQH